MASSVCLILPVRLSSDRLPNKVLMEYKGKPLLEHSITIAKKLDFVDNIIVVSSEDNPELKRLCEINGVKFKYLEEEVSCGSEKLYHISKITNYDYYMTLPVDEPEIDPLELNRVWRENSFLGAITTLYTKFYKESDLISNFSCKLAMVNDNVLYTSRSIIPGKKSSGLHNLSSYKKHVGVFIFPSNYIHVDMWDINSLAFLEGLEQNMFLRWNFKAYEISHKGFGIDTFDQISQLEDRF